MEKIGKYDLLGKIGVGGFGEVYKGRDPLIKRLVAIKTCNSTDPLIRERFFKEAEIAGNLHHRNITIVYDFGLQDDLPYLVQEYLSGEDLDHKIKRGDFLPYPEKLFYLIQIARGLAYAHSQGVVHRDIKPGNIRILEDGTAKILDFGIAKLAQQETGLTQTGMTLGTAAYLAPEQIRGETASHRTDVFSFGILAYELLTYGRPFPGQQISVVIHQILDLDPQPLIEKWPEAPAEVVAVIERCLDKDPARRYAHGGELLRALEVVQKKGRSERRTLEDVPTVKIARTSRPPPSPPSRPATGSRELPTKTATQAVSATRTLADSGFGSSGPNGELSAPRRRSRAAGLIAVLLLAVLAAAGGWWIGQRGSTETTAQLAGESDAGHPTTPDDRAVEAPAPDSGGVGAGTAPDPGAGKVEDQPSEETASPAPVEDGETPDGAKPPLPESNTTTETPPPPPPPARGLLVIEAAGWTGRMTAEVDGETYPLVRRQEILLPPGTRDVTFVLDEPGYARREAVTVDLAAGQTRALSPPILPPGAISVRPLPTKPRGEVWLDGELLGKTPLTSVRTSPGPHRLEIRSLDGEEKTLEREITIESGQDTIVSFDLDIDRVSTRNKEL